MSIIQRCVKQGLLNEIEEYRKEAPEVLDIEGASRFFDISTQTLKAYMGSNNIPFKRLGNKFYFSKENLIEWVKKQS